MSSHGNYSMEKRPIKLRTRELRESRRQERLRHSLYHRRYLIPNAVTVGNMFCGFLAIVYAASGRFEKAALAIGFAILLDGLDGRVARSLNATSKFGVEFDSLSDLVSFGIAPSMIMYHWCYRLPADEFGVFVTFIYSICAASRLARFNIGSGSLASFDGLPSPGAAGAVAAVVYFAPTFIPSSPLMLICITALLLSLSFLMVSNIEYLSVKQLKVNRVPFTVRIGVAALIGFLWYNNQVGFLILALGYCLSGPILTLLTFARRKDANPG